MRSLSFRGACRVFFLSRRQVRAVVGRPVFVSYIFFSLSIVLHRPLFSGRRACLLACKHLARALIAHRPAIVLIDDSRAHKTMDERNKKERITVLKLKLGRRDGVTRSTAGTKDALSRGRVRAREPRKKGSWPAKGSAERVIVAVGNRPESLFIHFFSFVVNHCCPRRIAVHYSVLLGDIIVTTLLYHIYTYNISDRE